MDRYDQPVADHYVLFSGLTRLLVPAIQPRSFENHVAADLKKRVRYANIFSVVFTIVCCCTHGGEV